MITEIVVSLSLLALLMTGLAVSLHQFADFNRYQLARQHCVAAAHAQLDSIAVTGSPLSSDQLNKLWPDVVVHIRDGVCSGQWKGTRRLEVEAVKMLGQRPVRIELQRYIAVRE
jgi:type II secretory pathway pseudopilin PulG